MCPQREFDAAVIFLPKSKDLTDYLLNAVAARLPGAELFLVGEKKKRYRKCRQADDPLRQAAQARQRPALPAVASHRGQRAASSGTLESLAQVFEVPLAEGPLEVVSLPGVFSHGRLDRGTELLLEHLDKLPSGHLLDFGCGAGVLGRCGQTSLPAQQA